MTARALPLALAIVLLAGCGSSAARGGAGVISSDGRIGALRIDVSTAPAIVGFAGRPDLTVTGSFDAAFAGFPTHFRALAYGCSRDRKAGFDPGAYRPAHRYCRTVYFINPKTRRLAAFWTESSHFHTASGSRPGMAQVEADRREHRTVGLGAFTGIRVTGRRATLLLDSSCRAVTRKGRGVCVGGNVLTLELVSRHHDVGLLFE